jgi:hypothetical protein
MLGLQFPGFLNILMTKNTSFFKRKAKLSNRTKTTSFIIFIRLTKDTVEPPFFLEERVTVYN